MSPRGSQWQDKLTECQLQSNSDSDRYTPTVKWKGMFYLGHACNYNGGSTETCRRVTTRDQSSTETCLWHIVQTYCTTQSYYTVSSAADCWWVMQQALAEMMGCLTCREFRNCYQISYSSKQNRCTVIPFLSTEGCQPVKTYQRMQKVYQNAHVPKIKTDVSCAPACVH